MAARDRPTDDQHDSTMPALPGSAFEDVRVETESMGDGRLIHYYRWAEPDPVVEPATPDDV